MWRATFAKSRIPFIVLLMGGLLFINLFVATLAGLSLRESYRQHQTRAELTSQNIALLMDKQLASNFEKIDLSMLAVADEVERQIAATRKIDGQSLKKLVGQLQTRVPEIDSLRVADANGVVRYGTGIEVGSVMNIGDLEYFIRQRDSLQNNLLIARPVYSSLDRKWVIPSSRRIEGPDGRFAGVVFANISIAYINQAFSAIDVGRNGSVALRNDDLALVARYPMLDSKLSEIGTKILFPEVQKLIQAGQNIGTVISRYPADNIQRTVSFRRISNFPLFILIGLSVDESLAEWHVEATRTLSAVGFFLFVTTAAAWWINRAWQQHRLQQRQLAEQACRIAEDVVALEQAGLKTRKLVQAVEQSPVAVMIIDARGTIEYVNPKFTEVTGYESSEAVGHNPGILKSGLTPSNVYQDLWAAVMSGQEWLGELLNRKKNGELFWENTRISPLTGDDGKISHFIVIKEDITERKKADAQLRKLSLAVEHSPASVMVTNFSGVVEYVNPKFSDVSGYSAEEMIGKSPKMLKSGLTPAETYRRLWETIRSGKEWSGQLLNRTKKGELFWESQRIAPISDEHGEITHFVALKEDITERIRYEEQLVHQATHDVLTGLANRSLLMDRIEQAIANAHRYRHGAAVLVIDLDHFKYINDSLGHAVGDLVVKEVAERLSACAREGDTVARMGGDEFVMVLYHVDDEPDVAKVMQRVVGSMTAPLLIEGRKLHVTCSVGASIFPKDGDCAQDLLRNADTAMYRAKERGRNDYWFYTADMNTRMMERLTLESNLRHALENGEFVLHYQPQVDLRSGLITGAEALIRWRHPTLGMIPPVTFIPLAEETGLIVPIGDWVLGEVCRQIKWWQAAGLPQVRVAVNISAVQFRQKSFTGNIRMLLEEYGLEGASLELELTESMLINDVEGAIAIMRELKAINAQLSLDDFGTGYSSLNYLKRFPIDVLKLDQSFVRDIQRNTGDAAIAKTVIGLGHSLNLKVVAEGVETAAQLAFMRSHDADLVQGYYFSPPVAADEFAALLAKGVTL